MKELQSFVVLHRFERRERKSKFKTTADVIREAIGSHLSHPRSDRINAPAHRVAQSLQYVRIDGTLHAAVSNPRIVQTWSVKLASIAGVTC